MSVTSGQVNTNALAEVFYPPMIKRKALSLLQAYRVHMREITPYKTYGWNRVRNDVMREFDKPGFPDPRLTPQDLQAFEKSGGQIGDAKFWLIDRFIRVIEMSSEYAALKTRYRHELTGYFEKFFSDFYHAPKREGAPPLKHSYFSAPVTTSPPHIILCQIAPCEEFTSIPFAMLRIPLSADIDGFDPHEFYQRNGRLNEYVLPLSGFLIPNQYYGLRDSVVPSGQQLSQTRLGMAGTAKAKCFPLERSPIQAHLDFDFQATASQPEKDAEVGLEFDELVVTPSFWFTYETSRWTYTEASKRTDTNFKKLEDKEKYSEFFSKYFPEPLI